MTAREEAKELIQLFYNNQCSHSITELAYKSAKQCALICVDEKIKAITKYSDWDFETRSMAIDDITELQEVKQEINKL